MKNVYSGFVHFLLQWRNAVKPLIFRGIFLEINQAQLANVLLICMIYIVIF